MAEPWLWPVVLGGLGLIFGSFIATVIIRLPEGRSAIQGRSKCDGCGAVLSPAELVPLIGYVLARGKCRRCGGRIDPLHPVVELLALAIGVAAGWEAPGIEGVAGAIFGWLLLLLGGLDYRAFWLPDWATGSLAAAGLVGGMIGLWPDPVARLIGGAMGLGLLLLVAAMFRRLRGYSGMGGGDPKLVGAIGLWLGWAWLAPLILVASLVGIAYVLLLMLVGRRPDRGTQIPFGVMLAIAAFPLWLFAVMTRA